MNQLVANAPVVYHLRPLSVGAHLFEVTCRIEQPSPDGQLLSLPAWIPGSYLVRDYARHVVQFQAESGGEPVAARKLDKHTWRAAPVPGELLVRIRVYAADPSVRGAWLDRQQGFVNGVSVFLRVHGQEQVPSVLHIDPPEFPPPAGAGAGVGAGASAGTGPAWRLSTGLQRLTGGQGEFGAFRAASYADLIDHPILMGPTTTVEFLAAGVPHALVLAGIPNPDRERLQADLTRLCTWHIDFFGRPAPMSRYAFLARVAGEGYGGLEHRGSSVLSCRRDDLPQAGLPVNDAGYRRFLGLVSHEYFHAWHVTRIRPAEFVDADLSAEVYTHQLWIFEGITSYYDDLALRRSGLITVEQYLEILGRSLTQLYRTAGRRHQTLEEASFDAWIKFYRPDENSPNSTISYYLKGALVALALDLELRSRTAGTCSLDAVMRTLWQEYGADDSPGLPEGQFERLAASLSGLDLEPFFRQALRTTIDPPLGILLAQFGVRLHMRGAESDGDAGGVRGRREERPRPWLGIRVQMADGRVRLSHVAADSPAQQAGLAAGDELLALGGRRVTPENWEASIDRLIAGDEVQCHVFRDQQLLPLSCSPVPAPRDTCYLSLDPEADAHTVARRNAWLGMP
ncbi:MAG: PDZ domain-containing protein [Gammaproteobacteria bacterium]|nr:PDZ domain-containing protein [Gammaproteobacteria bacterium]